MINQLLSLGPSLEPNWDRDLFPIQAHEALHSIACKVNLEVFESQIADWILSQSKLPDQVNLFNIFGEPALTLFNNGQFVVDLYFWRKNDTLIHSHAFRGAFKVLFGHSLQEEFLIHPVDPVGRDIYCSQVSRSKVEVLSPGDVRTIHPGMQLTHRILHLDNPTVTLCLRTVNDTELSQWHHLSGGVSYKQKNISPLTVKKVLYFQFLTQSDYKRAEDYFQNVLDSLATADQLALYEALFKNEFGLDDDPICAMIDLIRSYFLSESWFPIYEQHYQELNTHLFEYNASTPALKILAHAINSNFLPKDAEELIQSFSKLKLPDLGKELLQEKDLFADEHFTEQSKRVKDFCSY